MQAFTANERARCQHGLPGRAR